MDRWRGSIQLAWHVHLNLQLLAHELRQVHWESEGGEQQKGVLRAPMPVADPVKREWTFFRAPKESERKPTISWRLKSPWVHICT